MNRENIEGRALWCNLGLGRWLVENHRVLYKDYKTGGSVITERLYIDIKQDFKNK